MRQQPYRPANKQVTPPARGEREGSASEREACSFGGEHVDGLTRDPGVAGILQNGAPVRFGIVLTPGAARKSVSAKARTAVVPGSNGARLLPLASVYENPTWEGDADVKAMEAKAQSPGGDALPVSSVASDDDASDDGDAESERLGLLMSKLFMFCKRKLGSSTAVNFLAQSQEVREVSAVGRDPPPPPPISLREYNVQRVGERHRVTACVGSCLRFPTDSYQLMGGQRRPVEMEDAA